MAMKQILQALFRSPGYSSGIGSTNQFKEIFGSLLLQNMSITRAENLRKVDPSINVSNADIRILCHAQKELHKTLAYVQAAT